MVAFLASSDWKFGLGFGSSDANSPLGTKDIRAFTQTTEQGKTSPRKEPLSCEDFLGDSDVKESACSAGDPGSILGSGRSPGKGNGNPLQYSCLENSKDRGAWWAAVHEVAKTWA